MKLLALPPLCEVALELAGAAGMTLIRAHLERFANGELQVSFEGDVAGEDCVALGSVTPPDEQMIGFLLLCHTLRKGRARSVRAVLPYLAYARQDRDEPGKSQAATWMGAVLAASGADSLVTVDVHSAESVALYPVPVVSLSPGHIFAEALKTRGFGDLTIVSPDRGACDRSEAVRDAAGIERPVAWFTKERSAYGVRHLALNGSVGPEAVIVDDILDTGATLISACQELQRRGVRKITIMVTHGLFTGNAWMQLWRYGVNHMYCTDTVPLPAATRSERITILPIASLLADALRSPFAPDMEEAA